jgi:uncharacterized membrane protein
MTTNRLEAFSDGVLAIIITVMVLELREPDSTGNYWHSLVHHSGLSLLTYVLSFVYIGIYWTNHHHLFQIVDYVDGSVLWGNLHLLFWLSLYPFTTSWLDASHVARTPTVVYGLNLLAAAIAYYILMQQMMRVPGTGPRLREVIGNDLKGKLSPVIYIAGILLALVEPWLGLVPFVVVALMWLVPDRRVERYLAEHRDVAG